MLLSSVYSPVFLRAKVSFNVFVMDQVHFEEEPVRKGKKRDSNSSRLTAVICTTSLGHENIQSLR